MRAVVTGGGGYIGHRLGMALANSGHEVLLLDLAAPAPPFAPRLHFACVDIRDEPCEPSVTGMGAAPRVRQ